MPTRCQPVLELSVVFVDNMSGVKERIIFPHVDNVEFVLGSALRAAYPEIEPLHMSMCVGVW